MNLTEWQSGLAERLSINDFGAGILLSAIFLFIPMLPLSMYETSGFILRLTFGLVMLAFFIAVNWLPQYLLIVHVLTLALLLSSRTRSWITGGD